LRAPVDTDPVTEFALKEKACQDIKENESKQLLAEQQFALDQKEFFYFWMLHGSTKVVVRAVALLSAKTE